MIVTIISDASYCPKTQAAGYGFWAVSTRGKHAGGGSFKSKISKPWMAECCAIVNALHVTLALGIALRGDKVLIQTDCRDAITGFEGNLKKSTLKRNADIAATIEKFAEIRRAHELAIEFRHVRGHTRVGDQRSKAQRMCDRRAYDAMNAARAALAAERGEKRANG